MEQLSIIALDEDPDFLVGLREILSDISESVHYQPFCDEERFFDCLYADDTVIDAAIICADAENNNVISLASVIAERFKGIEIIFLVSACTVKKLERLFLSSCELRPFAVLAKPVEKEVLKAVLIRLKEAKNKRRRIIMLSTRRKYVFYRTSDIIMIRSQKRRIYFVTEKEDIRTDKKNKGGIAGLFFMSARKLSDKRVLCKIN